MAKMRGSSRVTVPKTSEDYWIIRVNTSEGIAEPTCYRYNNRDDCWLAMSPRNKDKVWHGVGSVYSNEFKEAKGEGSFGAQYLHLAYRTKEEATTVYEALLGLGNVLANINRIFSSFRPK